MTKFCILIATASLWTLSLEAISLDTLFKGGHRLNLGPDLYHIRRTREGGSQQSGELYGGRLAYERFKAHGLYWRVMGRYASGKLSGKTGAGAALESKLLEREIEGVVGYTFCWQQIPCLTLTPYLGGGTLWSRNKFKPPSPLSVHFNNRITYASAGLVAYYQLTSCCELGLRYTSQLMHEGESKVANDPVHNDVILVIDNKAQHHVELPIAIRRLGCCHVWFTLTPYYCKRHFGGRENWPFNYIDTKFEVYGGSLALECRF